MSSANIFEFEFQLGGTITPEMKRAFDQARQSMGGLEKQSKISMKSIKAGAAVAVTAFVAVGAAIGKVVASAGEYQSAMQQIQASTGVSAKEMQEIKEISKNLYNENLGEDFNDLAEAVTTARQVTQLQGKDLQEVTEKAILYRDVFGEDITQSIKASDTMMKNFGITADQAYNLLAQGAQKGLNKSDELIDSANEYAPYYKTLGFSANEMFDSFSNGLKNGAFNLDKVGDAVKEFNIRAKDGSKSSAEAFMALGLDAQKMTDTFAKGGPGAKKAFKEVATALAEMKDPAEQNAVAVQLFGTQAEDLEMNVITSMANIKKEFDGTKKTMEEIKDVKYDTLGAAFQGIGRQLYTGFVLPLGDALLPTLQTLSSYASTAIPKVAGFFKTSFGKVKETITTVSKSFGGIKSGLSSYINVLKTVFEGAKSTISIFAPYVKSALGGVFLFVKTAIKSVANFWQENGAQIMQAVRNVFSVVQAVIGFVMPFILIIVKSVWGNIKGVITGALNIIMGVIKIFAGLFTGDFKKMWEGAKQIFAGAISGIWNLFNLMFYGKILGGIRAVGKLAVGGIRNMWGSIKNFFASGVTSANQKVVDFAHAVGNGFRTAKTKAVDIVKEIWSSVKNYFGKIVDGAKALPGKMGAGIKNNAKKALSGITSMGNDLLVGIGKIVNGVINGLNWAGGKIGIDAKLPNWTVPQYARGTDGHPGGLAVLGDGGGSELFRTPNGKVGLSPAKDTLMNLPKGTQVIPHRQTAQILASISPKYEFGTGVKNAFNTGTDWLSGAYDSTKSAVSSAAGTVADVASDTMDYLSSPKKLFAKILEKFNVSASIPGVNGYMAKIAKGGFNFVKDGAMDWIKDKLPSFGSQMGNVSGGASSWASAIQQAAMVMQVSLSQNELQGIISQINRESTGNAQIIQSSAVKDINTRNGNPAKGLLQYIPQTFARYAVKGHGNIFNGYDQLLAFFNNSNWRRDLPYGKSGWGPSGSRRFEKGGDVNTNDAILVGENGPELLRNRKGSRILNTNKTQNLLENITKFKSGQTGQTDSKSVQVNLTYSPTINAEGNGSLDFELLMRLLKSDSIRFKEELKRLLDQINADNYSVAFDSFD